MTQQTHPRRPVFVGQGQIVERPQERELKAACSPIALMEKAARRAAQDTGAGDKIWAEIDGVIAMRLIIDSPGVRGRPPFGDYANPPALLAARLGVKPRHALYGPTGGNSPQYVINRAAEMLASGEASLILLAGSEALHSYVAALKDGLQLPWGDEAEGGDSLPPRQDMGEERDGVSLAERALGLEMPVSAYPLFETALMHEAGRTPAEQQAQIGRLMAPFSETAAAHPQAWFPVARSAEEIANVSDNNRYIGFPYTKYMNAVMRVNQGAALFMMTAQKAQELGIAPEKQVFLHGAADANDLWLMSERVNFHSSPAIRRVGELALAQAGWSVDEVDLFDIYSCFPSAVQVGRAALGIDEADKRPLTVTGGLPYFGGAGNNYTMHSVGTMIERLRAKPGSKGLCTANGWYLTKHALGLYSTAIPEGAWETAPNIQSELDNAPHPAVAEHPAGAAVLETYTITHGREGIAGGICFARLKENGARFPASLPDDKPLLAKLMAGDCVGVEGEAVSEEGKPALFTPNLG